MLTIGLWTVSQFAGCIRLDIPTYPSGHWLFGFASKKYDPVFDFDQAARERWEALGLHTRYYNTELHKGCFALPTYVKELLAERE